MSVQHLVAGLLLSLAAVTGPGLLLPGYMEAARSPYARDVFVQGAPHGSMNGIVCEAVYPNVSSDLGNIPIRNFYFDGTQSDLDRDIGIYLELARNYRARRLDAGSRDAIASAAC